MSNEFVSIILPTYNEAGNITALLTALKKKVKRRFDIIVVDDNSPDGTSKLVKQYIQSTKTKNIRLCTRKNDRGLTKSIQAGIDLARGDVVVWMDCDFSHPPEDILRLLQKMDEGYDVVVASRYIKGGKARRVTYKTDDSVVSTVLSYILNMSLRIILGYPFTDYTSGFVAARRSIFKEIRLEGDYGEYFITFIHRAYEHTLKIIEIPYVSKSRTAGYSKTGGNFFRLLTLGLQYIRTAFTILWEKQKNEN